MPRAAAEQFIVQSLAVYLPVLGESTATLLYIHSYSQISSKAAVYLSHFRWDIQRSSVYLLKSPTRVLCCSMLEPPPRKLLDQVRDAIRLKHYSYSTEKTYVLWIRRFILFHNKRHPAEMSTPEVTQFLTYLAVNEQVAATTQNQALHAIIFLYRVVLQRELIGVDAIRAKPSRYLPTVLTPDEVQRVIHNLYGVYKLLIQLLYGSGLRLSEGLKLRVKDVDFAQHQLSIRDTKGQESRVTMFPLV
jgi:integrase